MQLRIVSTHPHRQEFLQTLLEELVYRGWSSQYCSVIVLLLQYIAICSKTIWSVSSCLEKDDLYCLLAWKFVFGSTPQDGKLHNRHIITKTGQNYSCIAYWQSDSCSGFLFWLCALTFENKVQYKYNKIHGSKYEQSSSVKKNLNKITLFYYTINMQLVGAIMLIYYFPISFHITNHTL